MKKFLTKQSQIIFFYSFMFNNFTTPFPITAEIEIIKYKVVYNISSQ